MYYSSVAEGIEELKRGLSEFGHELTEELTKDYEWDMLARCISGYHEKKKMFNS